MNSDTLADYFKPILYKFHGREAIVYKTGYRSIRISYLDLYDSVYRMANWYQHQGLRKGDALLLWAPNGPEWVAALLACSLAGVIAVPLDVRAKEDFVCHIARETRARAGIKSKFTHIDTGFPWWDAQDLHRRVREVPPVFREPDISGDDVLEIVYTSGTTSEPKGVVLTNKNIVSNIASLGAVLSCDRDWKFLSVLPLSHMLEQNGGLFVPLFYGCSVTYLRTRKPAAILAALQEEGITSIVAVPQVLGTLRDRILREAESSGRARSFGRLLGAARRLPRAARRLLLRPVHATLGGRLLFFAVGGAPLDGAVEDFWNSLGLKVVQGYGLTEASPIVTCNTVRDPRPGNVGRVLPGQQIRLSGQGEILVRGDNVTRGYYKRPDLEAEHFVDGWYRTGDVGELDGDGRLRIRGRTKSMILAPNGMNVYPEDIEAELDRTPGVGGSCVLGLERDGRTVIHAVLLLDGAAPDGKRAVEAANARLADHQKIQSFSVWDQPDFPRTTTLKVQRRFVQEALEAAKGPAAGPPRPAEGGAGPLGGILRSLSRVPADRIVPSATLGLDLELDSLSRVELVGAIEEEFRVELDESLVTDRTTVAELEGYIASQGKAPEAKARLWPLSRWAVCGRWLLQACVIGPLLRRYMAFRVMGREKFDGLDKPCILVANHSSHLDAAVLTLALPWRVRRRIAVAAAADVFEEWDAGGAPLRERLLRKTATAVALAGLNIFPFQRYAGIQRSLQRTGRLMDLGWSIMIFPEGKLSHDGDVADFKAGVGLLVKELDARVVPARIRGAYEIMDYRHVWPQKRGEVTVRFGNPIRFPSDFTNEQIAERLEMEVRFL